MISDWLPTFTTIAAPRLLRTGTLPSHRPLVGAYWLAGSAHVENDIGIGC
ncbi:hypothetical protein [Xenorhabdus bovienii]|nr:hypothetical protein [Xenorhabdus bovienii]